MNTEIMECLVLPGYRYGRWMGNRKFNYLEWPYLAKIFADFEITILKDLKKIFNVPELMHLAH